ncbi:hypothetical protein AB0E10_20880 [Streptomyces sp. NPDC048045]
MHVSEYLGLFERQKFGLMHLAEQDRLSLRVAVTGSGLPPS